DMGPAAGLHGGEVVAQGRPEEISSFGTLTADYLTQQREIPVPETRRKGKGQDLSLKGATGHNLKNVSVDFPLGCFIAVTGVSRSEKSSLTTETLCPVLHHRFFRATKTPLP